MQVNAVVRRVILPGGFHCYYEHWLPSSPKTLIFIVHGIGNYTTKFRALCSELVKCGHAIALYDQRGFGRSLGHRGDAQSVKVWIDDLNEFVEFTLTKVRNSLPLIFLGEGFGAPLVISYLVERFNKAGGFVGMFSFMQENVNLSWWQEKLPNSISQRLPVGEVKLGDSDDKLSVNSLTLRAWKSLSSLMKGLDPLAYRLRVPVLMFSKKQIADSLDIDRDFFSTLQHAQKSMIEVRDNPILFDDLSRDTAQKIDKWISSTLCIR